MRRHRATLLTLALAALAACDSDSTSPAAPALSAGTYELIGISGFQLPTAMPAVVGGKTSAVLVAEGQFVLASDRTFAMTLAGSVDDIPTTLLYAGSVRAATARTVEIDFGKGTSPVATVDGPGFSLPLNGVILGFRKE
jgi:hypothetical protein